LTPLKEGTITIRIKNYTIAIYVHTQNKQVKNTKKCIANNYSHNRLICNTPNWVVVSEFWTEAHR